MLRAFRAPICCNPRWAPTRYQEPDRHVGSRDSRSVMLPLNSEASDGYQQSLGLREAMIQGHLRTWLEIEPTAVATKVLTLSSSLHCYQIFGFLHGGSQFLFKQPSGSVANKLSHGYKRLVNLYSPYQIPVYQFQTSPQSTLQLFAVS